MQVGTSDQVSKLHSFYPLQFYGTPHSRASRSVPSASIKFLLRNITKIHVEASIASYGEPNKFVGDTSAGRSGLRLSDTNALGTKGDHARRKISHEGNANKKL